MKNKVNPYRKPVSLGDVQKAKKQAQEEAITYTWAIFFSVMRDKFGWGNVRLKRLWNEVNDKSDAIAQGYISVNDLIETLKNEAGITLTKY